MSLHSTTDRFVEDLIKAAKESFARSPRRQPGETLHVQISGSTGHKLANHAGITAGLGSLAGLGGTGGGLGILTTPIGAAIGADAGNRWQAAGGALAGELAGSTLGGLAGGGLASLLHMDPRMGRQIGELAGGAGGAAFGAHQMGEDRRNMLQRAGDKLSAARDNGARAAAARFGVKEAFIGPLLGSIAGPMMARAGVGALARGAGGAALGGMASKVMPHIGGGMGSMAFDAASSMAGGALGDKLQQPRAPGL